MIKILTPLVTLLALLPACARAAPRSTRTARKEPRYGLVIAPMGDNSTLPLGYWLKGARWRGRNWDLAVLYYGDDPNFACKECKIVWRGHGAKWNLLYRFLRETKGFHKLAHRYAAVMVADDDLRMSAKELNTFFDVMLAFNLTVAQPALCPGSYSDYWNNVGRREGVLLHYTNFIDLMAPAFAGKFFDSVVRGTLSNAVHHGSGLEFVWPYLAGWSGDTTAVVDAVCMQNMNEPWRQSKRYNAVEVPYGPEEEGDLTMARFNLTQDVVMTAGMDWKVPLSLREVPAGTPIPKFNWRKKLDKSVAVTGGSDNHSGMAVFIVMLVACGGLLLFTGNQSRTKNRLQESTGKRVMD